ncbi:UNVERIFIED_ORG: hypothetical protein J2Y81_007836 [Paraburkholderia sediminicola]|nr:hypothetical protein [Paraburkholderia sediminicola]
MRSRPGSGRPFELFVPHLKCCTIRPRQLIGSAQRAGQHHSNSGKFNLIKRPLQLQFVCDDLRERPVPDELAFLWAQGSTSSDNPGFWHFV